MGVRIYVKPFINWIWGGCLLMALGGLLALLDGRYRLKIKVRTPAVVVTAEAAQDKDKRHKATPASPDPQTAA